MSSPTSCASEIASAAAGAGLEAAWRQWRALGAPVSAGGAPARAVVDPEALLLLSAALRDRERRLDDVLAWWAGTGAGLLSVQRTGRLARRFPPRARAGVAAFAAAARDAGDRRWAALARGAGETLDDRGKRGVEARLTDAPALVLRLRAGFGVGVKADVLAYLIGRGGTRATVREMADATAYTLAAVRRAAQEMAVARIVRATAGRPAAYAADPGAWEDLLRLGPAGPPPWRDWAGAFAWVAGVLEWADGVGEETSAYLAASRARDVAEAHPVAHVVFPEPARGAAYLDTFAEGARRVGAWMTENV